MIEAVKNYRKDYVKVYKDMAVTYGEFFEALQQLGFKDESNEVRFRFKKDSMASLVSISKRPLDEIMWKPKFLGYSHSLYLRDDIEDPDDLAKMIETNREKSKEQLAIQTV
jgi:hypothetical protein